MQELAIEAKPQQLPALRDKLQSVKSAGDFVAYLKANDIRSNGTQGERAAEEMPADVLDNVASMKNGQMVLMPSPSGALVILLVGSRPERLDEAGARAAIEQFLINDSRRKRIDADARSMRAAARIEFVGRYAEFAAAVDVPPKAASAPIAVAADVSAEDIRQAVGIKK
jgi:hypothetical protein